jgi:hypothetical protein
MSPRSAPCRGTILRREAIEWVEQFTFTNQSLAALTSLYAAVF